MIVDVEQAVALDRLDDALRLAPALGAELFRKVIDSGGTRLHALGQSRPVSRIVAGRPQSVD